MLHLPTGIVADLWGRKASRILGRISAYISMIVLIFSNGLYMYALSFAILAISFNLESGAALVYDSLKEINKEEDYLKVSGKVEMFMQISILIALPLGGYLAISSLLAGIMATKVYKLERTLKEKGILRENRATILSFQSMIFSLLMIFIFPLAGRIGDLISLNFTFQLVAWVGSIFMLTFYLVEMERGLGRNKNYQSELWDKMRSMGIKILAKFHTTIESI